MIEVVLDEMPPGNRNHFQAILRAAFNLALRKGWLKENPVLKLEFAYYQRGEIKALSNEVVAAMLADALGRKPPLLPNYTIGFFAGLRESELQRLLWSDVRLEAQPPDVMVRAQVSKTRSKRFVPLPENALHWLDRYFSLLGGRPPGEERVMEGWTPNKLAWARERNYRRAIGDPQAKWAQNCKRRTFATNFVAAHGDPKYLAIILGHTNTEVGFRHYVGGTTKALGLAYFEIRPPPQLGG